MGPTLSANTSARLTSLLYDLQRARSVGRVGHWLSIVSGRFPSKATVTRLKRKRPHGCSLESSSESAGIEI